MSKNIKPHLVVVDDEPQVLSAIEDQLEDEFVVHMATSGKIALEMLNELIGVSVLLSDQRMPGMTGDDLFARAAEISDATRVMITGYADLEAVIRAVNKGNIFGYVTKPWDNVALKLTLRKADEHHKLVRELQHERDLLRNLMESVPDEIYFKGLDHRYIRVNWPAACGQGMESPETAIGRLDSEFIPDDIKVKRIHDEDLRAAESGKPLEVDELRVLPDGTRRWLSTTKAPVRDSNGNVTSIVAIARDITGRKNLEVEVASREALLRRVLDTLPVGVWVTDRSGKFIMNNPAGEAIWNGKRNGSPEIYSEYKGWWPDSGKQIEAKEWAVARAVEKGETSLNEVIDIECFDGARKTILNSAVPILDAQGAVQGAVMVHEDITERRAQEKRIVRLTRMRTMLSGINSTIVRVTSQDELFKETCRLAVEAGGFRAVFIATVDSAGTTLIPVVTGGVKDMVIPPINVSNSADAEMQRTATYRAFRERRTQICNDVRTDLLQSDTRAMAQKQDIGSFAILPLSIRTKSVGVLALAAAETGVFDDDEIRLLEELAGDVAFALETLENKDRLYYLALHDPLTGLANRSMFHEQLQGLITLAREKEERIAVAVVNLKRFRNINETLGVHAGDDLLKQVASRLTDAAGKERVARLSADFFGVILEDVGDANAVARRVRVLRNGLSFVYQLADRELHLDTRVGVALFPGDGENAEALSTNAEAALQKGKAADGVITFYTPEINAQVSDRFEIENRLRRALEQREFTLYFQPKMDANGSTIVGAEVLIRWQDPQEGLIAPMRFIPVLEETGLIVEVGNWVLEETACMIERLRAQGIHAPRMAVNVSPVQMRRAEFPADVIAAVRRGIPEKHIVDLEITESLLMENMDESVRKLGQLREAGFRIAVDDFGTGYSSLGYLSRLPIDALKIDASFIHKMADDANSMAIVSTIINLAHAFELRVVAEGVETEEQLKLLRLLRCDEIQGFLFYKPMTETNFTALLASRSVAKDPNS